MLPVLGALLQEGEAAGHAGPVSPFEVNFGLFFWTWIVFIALFLVLKRFAWPAILKATEDRERQIAKQLSEAEQANAAAKATAEEQRKLLGEARSQAQSMLAEAKVTIEKERASALEKTRQEQEALLERARRDIGEERDRALLDLRREAVDLSLAAAVKLVGERLNREDDRKLVMDYLSSLESQH
jgi:F-type H+-transporting ATPase subunit b